MFNKALDYEILDTRIDSEGRYVVLDTQIGEHRYTIANIYAPNVDCPQFFEEVYDKMDEFPNSKVILGGDFNVILDLEMDKKGGRPKTHTNSQKVVLDYMNNKGMCDIWRIRHPHTRQFTWHSWAPPYVFSRLDLFLISENIVGSVNKIEIKPGYKTDHAGVLMCINVNNKEQSGKGFWKYNCTLSQEPEYVDYVRKAIVECKMDNEGTRKELLWDVIKCRARGATVKYSSGRKKRYQQIVEELSNELSYFEHLLPSLNLDSEEWKECYNNIDILTMEINHIMETNSAATLLKSKCKYFEEGEKPTKYFFDLERKNRDNKCVTNLITDKGEVSGNKEILKAEMEFYGKLYSSKLDVLDVDNFYAKTAEFLSGNKFKITDQDNELLTKPITEKELYDVIKSCDNLKSPGTDGLTKEFYEVFWEDIKNELLESFNDSLSMGSLSISQKQGIITLIPKKDKDTRFLKNWRPLTLMNHDYKFLTKCLAQRLKGILPGIINADQTGFMENRYIGTNIIRLQDILASGKSTGESGLVIAIDFEKAFDCIEWEFMFKVLENYGFNDTFISWIKKLYVDSSSCIVTNGHISQFFSLERGVKQGCPLSPYLYIICAEALANVIRENRNIRPYHSSMSAVSLFADDTTLYIKNDGTSLNEVFKVLKRFEEISGLKVNLDKTQILKIGNMDSSVNYVDENLKAIPITNDITILGVKIGQDMEQCIKTNYQSKLDKIATNFNMWSIRDLSLFGRSLITKSLGMSQLVYLMSMLPSPKSEYFNEVESKLFGFLWKRKKDRIERTTLQTDIVNGGCNVTNVKMMNKSLKLVWLKRLVEDEGSGCNIIREQIPCKDLKFFLDCNWKVCDLPRTIQNHKFWVEVLLYWSELTYISCIDDWDTVLDMNIWFNNYIKIGKKVVFYQKWFEAGVKKIGDLYDVNSRAILTLDQFNEKYGVKASFIEYYGVLSAIPGHWKMLLKNKVENLQAREASNIDYIAILLNECKPNKVFYKLLMSKLENIPIRRIQKWEEEMEESISVFDFLDKLYLMCKETSGTKMKSFIYRMYLRDILTNRVLMKMGIKETNVCYICNKEQESLSHLFDRCTVTKRLWERLKLWYDEKTGLDNNFDMYTVMFKFVEIENSLTRFVFWRCMYYIYLSKLDNVIPTFECFLHKLKAQERIEFETLCKKGKMANYISKWGQITQFT